MSGIDIKVFAPFIKYLYPYKWIGVKGIIILSLAVILSLAPPLLIKEMMDVAMPSSDKEYLVQLFCILVATLIVTAVCQSAEEYYTGSFGLKASKDIRIDLYQHIQFLPNRFFLETKTGEITSRFTSDIFNIQRVISKTIPGLFTNIVMFVCAVTLMVNLNLELTLAAISTLPIYFLALYIIIKKNTSLIRKAYKLSDRINGNITDNFSLEGQLHSRLNGLQERNLNEFGGVAENIRNVRLKIGLLTRGNETLFHMLSMSGIALVYLIGGVVFINDDISIGTIVAFSVFVTRMYQPLSFFSTSAIELSNAQISAKRLSHYFSIPSESKFLKKEDVEYRPLLSPSDIAIRFNNVSFSYFYEERENQIINKLDLAVKKQSKVLITGPNGAGKSTLTQLIAGIYSPQYGEIFVNDIPLKNMDYKVFSNSVSVIFTHSFFTNSSLYENLLVVNPQATDSEISEALALSESTDFVEQLGEGIHTKIGQGGYKLSSGQRQRLAIARLILNPAPIVILDEATSNLNSDAELRIIEKLIEKLKDKTILFISHNSKFLKFADEVYKLNIVNGASNNSEQLRSCINSITD